LGIPACAGIDTFDGSGALGTSLPSAVFLSGGVFDKLTRTAAGLAGGRDLGILTAHTFNTRGFHYFKALQNLETFQNPVRLW
jgi:hypothetical protein